MQNHDHGDKQSCFEIQTTWPYNKYKEASLCAFLLYGKRFEYLPPALKQVSDVQMRKLWAETLNYKTDCSQSDNNRESKSATVSST